MKLHKNQNGAEIPDRFREMEKIDRSRSGCNVIVPILPILCGSIDIPNLPAITLEAQQHSTYYLSQSSNVTHQAYGRSGLQ